MAELAARGWNVAQPALDTEDDVFAIDDSTGKLVRIQVKAAMARKPRTETDRGKTKYDFGIPSRSLRVRQDAGWDRLFVFVMIAPLSSRKWTFAILTKERLVSLVRDESVGTRPSADKRKSIILSIQYDEAQNTASFRSREREPIPLGRLMDNWDDFFPRIGRYRSEGEE